MWFHLTSLSLPPQVFLYWSPNLKLIWTDTFFTCFWSTFFITEWTLFVICIKLMPQSFVEFSIRSTLGFFLGISDKFAFPSVALTFLFKLFGVCLHSRMQSLLWPVTSLMIFSGMPPPSKKWVALDALRLWLVNLPWSPALCARHFTVLWRELMPMGFSAYHC